MANNIGLYEEIVRKFIIKQNGHFFVISTDSAFLTNFRGTILKHLALPPTSATFYNDKERALKAVRQGISRKIKALVLIEREISGISNVEFVKYLKMDNPEVYLIILTSEIERERLILLHEMGVNNCITKPVSVNVLIEKLASTIKPPTKLGALIDKGKNCIFREDYKAALAYGKKVLELKPGSAAGLMLVGDALKGIGKRREALEAYREANSQAKLYLEPLKKLATFHKEEGDLDGELKYLETLDRLSPLNVDRKVAIGGISVKKGDMDRAKEMFDTAIKLTNRQAMGMLADISKSIAEICMEASPEMAEDYLRSSLEAKKGFLDRSDVESFNTLGIALRRQSRWKDAVIEYEKALEVAPDDENVLYNIAMAYFEGKDAERACQNLDKATRINPDLGVGSAGLSFNIGFIYSVAGRDHLAVTFFKRCLEANPEHKRARELLKQYSNK